jgi:hypothetical protein
MISKKGKLKIWVIGAVIFLEQILSLFDQKIWESPQN